MIRRPISTRRVIILRCCSLIAVLGAYTAWSHILHSGQPNYRMVPTWAQMVEGAQRILHVDPDDHFRWIVRDAQATFTRLGCGLAVSVAAAFIFGILMGCFRSIEAAFLFWCSAIAKIPATSVIAVIFVAVGTRTEMYVTVIAFGVVPVLAESVFLLVRDVPEAMLHKAQTLGASRMEVIAHFIVPMVLPRFIDAVRLQIGPALVYLIGAEVYSAYIGFGYRINKFARLTSMDVVFPYLIALACIGFVTNRALITLRARACPWFHEGGK